jgi:exopolysaccharide biosynthesis polyprenyl glycosylphosphotransferase
VTAPLPRLEAVPLPQAAEEAGAPAEAVRPRTRRRGWLVRRALLAADLLGLTVALLLAKAIIPGHYPGWLPRGTELALFFGTVLPAWVVAAKMKGLYARDEEHASHPTTEDLAGVFHLCTLGAWLLLAGIWLVHANAPNIGRLVTFWLAAIVMVTLARACARGMCRRTQTYRQQTLIVGAGEVGQLIARKILKHPEYGIDIAGFVDADPLPLVNGAAAIPVLGGIEDLPRLVREHDVERVVIAFTRDPRARLLGLVRQLIDLDLQVDVVPRFFEMVGPRTSVHDVEGLALVGLPPVRLPRSSRLMKRAVDLTLASLALVALAPLFALVALAIALDSHGPVFFRQVRMGARGRTFRIWKFRTMVADAEARKAEVVHLNRHAAEYGDARMFKIARDPRVTRVGRVLRRLSIDELPQLVNVLHGEMSLVGPRPLILAEDRHVEEWARRRLDLKPGMTGLWQVNGRSDIPFDEMVRLDYVYVTGWSLWADIRLILRTLPALAGRTKGAY